MSENKNGAKNLLDWLGGVAAFLTVAVYAVLLIHANWAFLPETLFNILVVCKTWAPLVVVALVGLEFTRGKGLITKLLFYALLAAVVVNMFFPDTWNEFVGVINGN
ncbi:MAG: hypothetical protein IJW24_00575 [Clostridia bacterium]|nr:hypothetical protein [Clostridia bacterium]